MKIIPFHGHRQNEDPRAWNSQNDEFTRRALVGVYRLYLGFEQGPGLDQLRGMDGQPLFDALQSAGITGLIYDKESPEKIPTLYFSPMIYQAKDFFIYCLRLDFRCDLGDWLAVPIWGIMRLGHCKDIFAICRMTEEMIAIFIQAHLSANKGENNG